jgi:hypothetical protein
MSKKDKKLVSVADWIKAIPSGFDHEEEEILSLEVALKLEDWFALAKIASRHGETLDEVVANVLYDVLEHDDLINTDGMYREEYREYQEEKAEAFKAAHDGMDSFEWHEHQKQKKGENPDDQDDDDWWKGKPGKHD